ncbi:uncharacterized protein [Penaeus vannamei]|uniref:uncharacterized protein n=1 Tax=Penaeus vannamei TaxID=6689 RepID=UPI00387F4C51
MKSFLDNNLLSNKQFDFRSKKSASDLLLLLVTNWNESLDADKETYVVAFDRVWDKSIISELRSFGIDSDLLKIKIICEEELSKLWSMATLQVNTRSVQVYRRAASLSISMTFYT